MKGGVCFYFASAVILLVLAGCGHGTSVAAREDGYAAVEDPNDDLSLGEHFGEANFGLGDPGVTVITADKGGNIDRYESKFFGTGNGNRRWVVDGYCNSACTMVLGTGRVCATPRAQFGFHAGYHEYFVFWRVWRVIKPQPTYQMYKHYPDSVKDWVNAHRAMDQIAMTMMRQPEVATYVPSCRQRAATGAVDAGNRVVPSLIPRMLAMPPITRRSPSLTV